MPPYESPNPWNETASWLRDARGGLSDRLSRFGTRAYPGMQAPIDTPPPPRPVIEDPASFYRQPISMEPEIPDFGAIPGMPDQAASDEHLTRKALEQYLSGVESGASSTAPNARVTRTLPTEGMTAFPEEAPKGKVDVTIDGKTYSYGGGQEGGAPSFASPSGRVEAFGRGYDANPGGGSASMVQLSEDSTTPMALQLREEKRARDLEEVLAAQKLAIAKRMLEDPAFMEKEKIRAQGEEDRRLVEAQGKSAFEAYNRAGQQKKDAALARWAMEQEQQARQRYGQDPRMLNEALSRISQYVESQRGGGASY